MLGKLYEVAIMVDPTKEEADKGLTTKLVFGPKPVVAADDNGALVAALLDGDRPQVDMQRARVLIRPFVSSSEGKSQDLRVKRQVPRSPVAEFAGVGAACFSELVNQQANIYTASTPGPASSSNVKYGKAPKWANTYSGASLAALTTSNTTNTQ